MEDNWKSLNEIVSLDNVNSIHCDTRDFHCMMNDKMIDLKDGKNPEIRRCVYDKKYHIPQDAVVEWLKSIEKMAGGKAEWRCLNFDNVECDGWLKYIRLYRNPKFSDVFIVCNRDSKPIEWEKCNEENLKKDQIKNSLM